MVKSVTAIRIFNNQNIQHLDRLLTFRVMRRRMVNKGLFKYHITHPEGGGSEKGLFYLIFK